MTSLIIWSVLFVALVILPCGWFAAYRYLNWRAWGGYQEPEGNQFFDALGANPFKGRYS